MRMSRQSLVLLSLFPLRLCNYFVVLAKRNSEDCVETASSNAWQIQVCAAISCLVMFELLAFHRFLSTNINHGIDVEFSILPRYLIRRYLPPKSANLGLTSGPCGCGNM